MVNFIRLVCNEIRLFVNELKQYWFETVTSVVVMSLMFLGLFMGVRKFSPLGDADSLEGLLFGYLLWNFATSVYNAVTSNVTEDNQIGLIEQLYLAPKGFVQVIMARTVVHAMWGIFMATLLTIIAMAMTGTWLEFNFISLYLLLILAAPSLVGMGFVMCGLTLIFKKVSTITAVLQILFIGLVAIKANPLEPLSFLPFTAGATMVRDSVYGSEPLLFSTVAFVCIISLVYVIAGIFIYRYFEQIAKKQNLIGQY